MNTINSIIFEGVVSEGVSENGVFKLRGERHTKVGEERITTTVEVPCLATGNMLESAKAWLDVGSGVRIVGRLQFIEDKVGIFAEHIEFKFSKPKADGVDGKYKFVKD